MRLRRAGKDVVVDHIVPLQGENVTGLHVEYNLQIITRAENTIKGNQCL
jgi:5-methylcytosine-specific restriction endonuclease McrA